MDKKKASAALAAVAMVMKTQEEAVVYSDPESLEADVTIITQPAAQPFNIWGISGRRTQMQANSMMQLRMFK